MNHATASARVPSAIQYSVRLTRAMIVFRWLLKT